MTYQPRACGAVAIASLLMSCLSYSEQNSCQPKKNAVDAGHVKSDDDRQDNDDESRRRHLLSGEPAGKLKLLVRLLAETNKLVEHSETRSTYSKWRGKRDSNPQSWFWRPLV